MRFYWFLLIAFICPLIVSAQTGTITGKVVRADTKSPVANASVFLNNATYGTSTAEDGTFTLAGVKPGQYQLVVTGVSIEEYSITVLVGREPAKLSIEVNQKVLMLSEVVISSSADWKKITNCLGRSLLAIPKMARSVRLLIHIF
ncbi:carboxypeptidase-like regulatory domain-containing protein [Mucilaginibacter sp. P25]|uniref:carboxypeptidase-like regulatory domain-containing protein n=1 Tax=Mucilaginibacter sp. P25 TaxID=3423945 RepID=UPI003D7A832E